jgi:hypothetical protein
MLAVKTLEVKLFRGYDFPFVNVATADVLWGAVGCPENVILIRRVSGNLAQPPPEIPENQN